MNPRHGLEDRAWPGYLPGGRIRTSTAVLILAFLAIWWLHATYRPAPEPPPQIPAHTPQVFPMYLVYEESPVSGASPLQPLAFTRTPSRKPSWQARLREQPHRSLLDVLIRQQPRIAVRIGPRFSQRLRIAIALFQPLIERAPQLALVRLDQLPPTLAREVQTVFVTYLHHHYGRILSIAQTRVWVDMLN